MWGKNEGACVPRWRGETRRGRLRAEMHRLLRGNRGRSAEGRRNDRENEPPYLRCTPRYNGLRAFGCRGVPQRSSKCAIALWEARARAERPPLWGSDDVSAMRNYRYRHRDSPYVAKRSGERTSRAGRPWAVGGELPGARWRGRPVCARGGRPCTGAAAAPTRGCRFFHPHPPSVAARGTAAGRKGGPISSASGSFSSLCWSWGRRARRRRRGTARARRGEEHRPCGAARGMRRA